MKNFLSLNEVVVRSYEVGSCGTFIEMPAMIAFSPNPGTRFRAASSGRTQITLNRLAADASPVIPCSEEMPPSLSWL